MQGGFMSASVLTHLEVYRAGNGRVTQRRSMNTRSGAMLCYASC